MKPEKPKTISVQIKVYTIIQNSKILKNPHKIYNVTQSLYCYSKFKNHKSSQTQIHDTQTIYLLLSSVLSSVPHSLLNPLTLSQPLRSSLTPLVSHLRGSALVSHTSAAPPLSLTRHSSLFLVRFLSSLNLL